MKNYAKPAKITELDLKSTPPKKLNTNLTKFPRILPRYMDAAHIGFC